MLNILWRRDSCRVEERKLLIHKGSSEASASLPNRSHARGFVVVTQTDPSRAPAAEQLRPR